MKKSSKLYILMFFLITIFSFSSSAVDPLSNFYENRISSSVCEGDSNIIKAGCSVAVGQVVRVTPGIVTGVTLDKMQECYDRYGPKVSGTGTSANLTATEVVIDLNDPCNQIAMTNPKMDKSKFAYIPFDENSVIHNSRPGFASIGSMMEVTSQKATDGLLMNREFYAAQTFKNVPYLKSVYASSNTVFDSITEFVFNAWQATRNIAYLLLLIASLVLGIVIMLGNQSAALDKDNKIKLSVERALPRVVMAVILISMSYWIGELILNTLLGGGITQGFAAFVASIIIADTNLDPSWTLSFPVVTVMMGVAAAIMAYTQGAAAIVVVAAIIIGVWKLFIANFLILKNIFELLVFIIFSPLILVTGVLPDDNTGEGFKRYARSLVRFIIIGFLLNLIIFSAKAVLIYGSYIEYDFSGAVSSIVSGISMFFNWIIVIAIAIYILGLANRVPELAMDFAGKIVKAKKEDKK